MCNDEDLFVSLRGLHQDVVQPRQLTGHVSASGVLLDQPCVYSSSRVSGVVVGGSWGQLSLTEVGFEVVVSVERHDAQGWVGLDSVIATVPVTQSGE